MKKLYGAVYRVQNTLISVLLILMLAVVLLAAFCRYTQLAVLSWPDELTRYLLIWLVFIGAGAASKNDTHFKIDVLIDSAPYTLKLIMLGVKLILTNVMYVILIAISADFIQKLNAMGQVSPAMHWPMWGMYMAVPAGCGLMVFQGVIFEIGNIVGIAREHLKGGEC
ncbi:TRAP transporter small permease [Marasmitruncus massiliensis]|uniref:TRAP transporter small permease n=1 Tax=Marasmitruncus massiliensis TaxID=1944642 RepID=UPI001FA8F020|nr:TRAP transporter small permease [Marasmitruncus massiliensis]